jgi:hypothetical protein
LTDARCRESRQARGSCPSRIERGLRRLERPMRVQTNHPIEISAVEFCSSPAVATREAHVSARSLLLIDA